MRGASEEGNRPGVDAWQPDSLAHARWMLRIFCRSIDRAAGWRGARFHGDECALSSASGG